MHLSASLPEPSNERIAVHVTNAALREIRAGHPWLWDGSVKRQSRGGEPGELAVVFDQDRKFAAIGLFDPDSPITVRVLHQGQPTTIDREFFEQRVVDALSLRSSLQNDPGTTAYRLINGENDGLPGLVADIYDRSLVIKLDTAAWFPHLRSVLEPLIELVDANCVVLRTSRHVAPSIPQGLHDGAILWGDAPNAPIRFRENGLLFEADIISGQKTGHFLDQRDNRFLLGERCRDGDVLDLFCNTGGFSVYAAAAGARSVHSIDVSTHAIAATERHIEINRAERSFDTEHHADALDAFGALQSLSHRGERFDVIVIDPPSFAPNLDAVPAARHAYRRLTRLALNLLGSGGTLFQASCSSRIDAIEFHDLVADEVDAGGFISTNEVRTAHALDHPINFAEGAYLKATLADLVRR